ncbi:MAG: hypothetical protein Q7N50_00995, partial [Armatimonadota bacterium]|nr:hypothetical protein [Armatimonadota bacterium]
VSGVRVEKTAHGRTIGQIVEVRGTPATNTNGERYISATTTDLNGSGNASEITLTNLALGGEYLLYNSITGAGQMGVINGLGLNNIGLLVRTNGRCSLNLANPNNGGDYYGAYYLFIDDGSGVKSQYRASEFSYLEVNGIKVEVNDPNIAFGDFVTARGISSIELINEVYQRRLQPRPGMGDVVRLQ